MCRVKQKKPHVDECGDEDEPFFLFRDTTFSPERFTVCFSVASSLFPYFLFFVDDLGYVKKRKSPISREIFIRR